METKMTFNLEDEIKIDVNNLNEELIKQPSLIAYASSVYSTARRQHQQLKLDLEVYQAKLGTDIRRNPADYGIAKITESAITNGIKEDKMWEELSSRLLDAEQDVNVISGLLQALQHRKDSLFNLCSNLRAEAAGELRLKSIEQLKLEADENK